jgi:hypothetical protein
MICPTCGAATSAVIDTRRGVFNTTTRRRECPRGHRFNTREVHEPVWCSAKQRAKVFAATVAARVKLRERDMAIARALHLGWKALASRYGIDKSTIYLAAERGRRHEKETAKG